MIRAIFVLLGFLLTETPLRAQTASADSDDTHYSYNRVEDGYLRLDTRTGEVSLCNRRATGWSCDVTPDERRVLKDEMTRLRAENAALKKVLLDRGVPLPGGVNADASAPVTSTADQAVKPPASTDVAQIKVLLADWWRRLVEMFRDLQRDVLKRT